MRTTSHPGLALLTALLQPAAVALATRGHPAEVGVLGYGLLILSGLALADRHRFPWRNFVIVAAASLLYQLLGHPSGLVLLAPTIAAAATLRAGHRWLVWTSAVATYVIWTGLTGPALNSALTAAALVSAAGATAELGAAASVPVGRALHQQRRLTAERNRRRASDERLRIAAELHDVLGHHLSLINVHAGVGLHLMDRQPEQARIALDTIQQASTEALHDVQSVLSTLYPAGAAAPRSPAPSLDRLDRLATDAGLPTRTVVNGQRRELPPGVDMAAYRIVQEALTNVRRHAGPGASATITIEYLPDALVIQLDDDGTTGSAAPPGKGITGMRERVVTLGGALTAGPSLSGGWRVCARLPLAPGSTP